MSKPVDRLYPLKSTCVYVAVALLVDTWALLQRSFPPSDRAVLWAGGGVLIYVPWGRPAVVLSALLGLGIGTAMALPLRVLLDRHLASLAEHIADRGRQGEPALLAAWLATAVAAYYLGDALLFPRLSGTIAAMNVFAARVVLHPTLAAAYEAATWRQTAATASAATDAERRAA